MPLNDKFALFPLTSDESTTCESILTQADSGLLISPNHHIDQFQQFCGFRFDCAASSPGSCLPVVRNMFFGHTLVECSDREDAILRLMSQPAENRAKMQGFLERVERECVPARLDSAPENASIDTLQGRIQAQGLLSVDSKPWTPEVPDRIGLYHAYIRGFNRDVRTHRLFIVCSGGMSFASDAFCNLLIDVGHRWTAKDVCESEEAWFLRKGGQRARCRLIKMLADEFKVNVTHMQDIQAYDKHYMAIPTSETLEHDIADMGDGRVAVYNLCADTTRKNANGFVCNMHPSEGVWLFRGAPRGSCYGSMYGDHRTCGVIPTCAPRVARRQSILVKDSECIVRLRSAPERAPYVCFDERWFRNMEAMQWNRDHTCVELVPIVVGLP